APHWRFPEELALPIRKQAGKARCSVYSAIEATEMTLFRDDVRQTGWPELKNLLRDLKVMAAHAPVTTVFDELARRLKLTFLPRDQKACFVGNFRKFLESWEEKSETPKLSEFMEYFQYFVEAGGTVESPELENSAAAVQMMSVHAAKGLEFPVVF